jgi:hypothetical protein
MYGREKINYYHDVGDKPDETKTRGWDSRNRSTFYLNNIIGKKKT